MPVRLRTQEITAFSPKRPPVTIPRPSDPQFASRRVHKSLIAILQATELCSIATVTPTGGAHISHVYFNWSSDLEFVFLSDPRSIHCRNILTNPSMAMTVYDSDQPWYRPGQGVHLWGRCAQAKGAWAPQAESLYARRFEGYAEVLAAIRRDDRSTFQYRFYRFTPRQIKILDEASFGGGVFVTAAIHRSPKDGSKSMTHRTVRQPRR
jgi:hypothetical protein